MDRVLIAVLVAVHVAVHVAVLLIVAGCSSSSEPPLTDDPPARPTLDVVGAELSAQLTWHPAPESDFAGYRIYRSRRGCLEQGGGFVPESSADPQTGRTGGAKGSGDQGSADQGSTDQGSTDQGSTDQGSGETVLWDEIFVRSDTTWTDEWVSPGHRYVYALTVVDQAGQESVADSVSVTASVPESPHIGWEPRRARWSLEEELELTLWVTGATDLSGIVVEVIHDLPLEGCDSESLFGSETLFLCQTEPRGGAEPNAGAEGPIQGVEAPIGGAEVTTVAVSSIRGGPTLTGAGIVGAFRFLVEDIGTVLLPISVVAFESADSAPPVVLAMEQKIEE